MTTQVKKGGLSLKKISINLLKVLILAYIVTGILLLILALIMYKVDISDKQIQMGIIFIMILSSFIAGLLFVKIVKEKRLLMGGATGIAYFLILIVVSLMVQKDIQLAGDSLSMFFICLGSGALGGMFG